MESVTLQVLLSSRPREILLYSLVHPSFFTKQTWKLLCRQVLSASWSDYKHISNNPRRRFVEIAYRKGLQGELGYDLYSRECQILFAIFRRDQEELEKIATRFPQEAQSLYYKLEGKKEKVFFQGELYTIGETISIKPHVIKLIVGQAELRKLTPINHWFIRTRLLINGDEESLNFCKQVAFPSSVPSDKLEELVLQDRTNMYSWLEAYSFTENQHMIEELFSVNYPHVSNAQVKTIVQNLYTSNNLAMISKLGEKYFSSVYLLSFEEKLHCLTNYYLYSGDDRGLYKSLLQVMREKQPLTKETNIIFELELYEVRELLRREGIRNPLTQNFL
nr:hypothetical protein Cbor_339 [Cedratvirus borely]